MSEPIWCEIRQRYCRCHDYGPRCEDAVVTPIVCPLLPISWIAYNTSIIVRRCYVHATVSGRVPDSVRGNPVRLGLAGRGLTNLSLSPKLGSRLVADGRLVR